MADTRTTLVGRERHLREIRLLVDAVSAGESHVLVLSGEAGAGKTTLVQEAVLHAKAGGVDVGWATCWRNAAAPLSVWTDLVEDAGVASTTIPAAAASDADPEGARVAWVRALARHLLEALGARPRLLVVDDLQWADPLSMHAIEALAALVRSSTVGLLCTVRDDDDAGGRADYLAGRGRHVVVPPLTEAELGVLAVELTGRSLPPRHAQTSPRSHGRQRAVRQRACSPIERSDRRCSTNGVHRGRRPWRSSPSGRRPCRHGASRRCKRRALSDAGSASTSSPRPCAAMSTSSLDLLGEAEAADLVARSRSGRLRVHPSAGRRGVLRRWWTPAAHSPPP